MVFTYLLIGFELFHLCETFLLFCISNFFVILIPTKCMYVCNKHERSVTKTLWQETSHWDRFHKNVSPY
jgi:hypothetical protein